jgi:hypothetical protein
MNSNRESPQKTKTDLQYDLVVPLLGIYLKECKPEYSRATGTPMFFATLFTIAKL